MDDDFKHGGVVAHCDGLNLVDWNFTVLSVIKKTFAKKNYLEIRNHNYSFILKIIAIELLGVAGVNYELVILGHQLTHLERLLL